jgi:hypothetical protein
VTPLRARKLPYRSGRCRSQGQLILGRKLISVSILATCKTVYSEAYGIVRRLVLESSPQLILDHPGCLCTHAFKETLGCFFTCLQHARTLLLEGSIFSQDLILLHSRRDRAIMESGPSSEQGLKICLPDRNTPITRSEPRVSSAQCLAESISLLMYHFDPDLREERIM